MNIFKDIEIIFIIVWRPQDGVDPSVDQDMPDQLPEQVDQARLESVYLVSRQSSQVAHSETTCYQHTERITLSEMYMRLRDELK